MQLQVKPTEYGIEEKQADSLTKGLSPVLSERENLIKEFEEVSSLEVNEENIPTFKELRLRIVKNRTQGINKWHKASKEFFLAGGRFVDAIKNKENQVNEEMESKLMAAEKHFENLEKERLEKLQAERSKQLSPYVEEVEHLHLSAMDEDVWEAYLSTKKSQYEAKVEAERKAEEERLEQLRLDKLEQDRRLEIAPYNQFNTNPIDIRNASKEEFKKFLSTLQASKAKHDKEQEEVRKENERLKKEREAAEAKAKKEKEEREAKADGFVKLLLKDGYRENHNSYSKRGYSVTRDSLLSMNENEFNVRLKEVNDKISEEDKHQAQLKKEREAREKLEKEAREKKEAEEKRISEEKAEAERLAKAPVKEKLSNWVNSFELPEDSVNNEVSKDIVKKFEAFKNWSLNQVADI